MYIRVKLTAASTGACYLFNPTHAFMPSCDIFAVSLLNSWRCLPGPARFYAVYLDIFLQVGLSPFLFRSLFMVNIVSWMTLFETHWVVYLIGESSFPSVLVYILPRVRGYFTVHVAGGGSAQLFQLTRFSRRYIFTCRVGREGDATRRRKLLTSC